LGVSVSVRDVFAAPTVRTLALEVANNAPALRPITAADPRPDRIPLSFAQQRMWLVNQINPGSGTYNIPTVLRLSGSLDIDALHAAIVDVVARHEVLRTTYPAVDGEPRQKILRASGVAARLDWDIADTLGELEEAVVAAFDIAKQLPIRVRLWEAAPQEYVLAVVVHHIAFDGESMGPMVVDLITAYVAEFDEREPEFAALPVQFADYAIWQHEVLGSPDASDTVVGQQLEYWRTQLAGLPDVVELPADRPRPAVATHGGAQVFFEIPADVARAVDRLAAESGATPFMVVHAALAVLIARMSAQDDIAIGTPIAGRGHEVLDRLVGMFVNTLVLRTAVDGGMSFTSLVAAAKNVDLEAFANADAPFESVVEVCRLATSQAYSPFSQVWLTLDQSSVPELAGENVVGGDVAGLSIAPFEQSAMPAKVDLLVGISRVDDGPWNGAMVHATDLFDEGTVQGFAKHLVTILAEALSDPAIPVGDITLPAFAIAVQPTNPSTDDGAKPAARRVPASDSVITSGPGTDPLLLPEIFANAAHMWGARQAVVDPDGAFLTYAQLDERSNRLARWLIGRDIGPESLVALAIGRSSALLTAIWAVAKTGGGYVPIDPTYPLDRVANMVEDSQALIGLAVAASGDLPEQGFDWIRLDERTVEDDVAALSGAQIEPDELHAPVRIDNTAYVIYTSGSTGRPKGVSVTHSGLANFAAEEVRRSSADEYSRILGFASPSFDASVLEYLLASWSGGVLVYRPDDAVGGSTLQNYLMQHAITHTFLTPTVLATVDPAAVPALRVVYAGGEAVPQALKDSWAPFRRIQNLYGPTETTIGVAISEPMQIGAPVYLGGPIAGVGFLVLDNRLKPVPPGVPGELYLCGDALSRGYLARPGLTATRFVANPYGIPGDRMYRTGDLVRWRSDETGKPTIEYTGRTDDQVKLRGLRIELGEVEAVLVEHPDVTSAVVLGVGGPVASALAGYVVSGGDPVDIGELRSFVAERLPSHMVPATIMAIDELPMTPVGKLDKTALPEPVIEVGEYVAPATDEERAVAAVFAEVLGVEQVSVIDSFFDLGGNSLSAMRLVGRVGQTLDVAVTIQDVFTAPRVRDLAAALAGRAAALPPVLPVSPRPDRIPLSFAQQRMWFLNRFDPGTANYNIPLGLRLSGSLDVEALRSALVDVVGRHEILRTTFPAIDGVPYQQIHSVDMVSDLVDWQVTQDESEFVGALAMGFDVTVDQPVRLRLLETAPNQWALALVAHHIAVDGESLRPLAVDLLGAYAARAAGNRPRFIPLEVQFADFAIWQHEVLGSPGDPDSVLGTQLAYWREQLRGLPDVVDLPTDHPRPPVASGRGALVSIDLPAEVGDQVRQVATASDATPFIVLHAALAALLARLSASDEVVVSAPFAGRGQAQLDPLVGMFVNTLVLRAHVDSADSFTDLVELLKVTDFDAFAHSDVPFEALVEDLNPARSEAFVPLAQVMLSVDPAASAAEERFDLDGLTVEPFANPGVVVQRDLTFYVRTAGPGEPWVLSVEYSTDLYASASMAVLAQRFGSLLAELTQNPEIPVGDAVLVGAETAPAAETGPQVALPPVVSVADVVAAQVLRTPVATALVFGDREVSYGEFGARVSALARVLIAAGVGLESAVA
ncbi:MAG: amino acid adenylation domain-containing protein, partial [Gordonia sp. (in: high G+C Gram-positive bacteria)]|uniref:amino acid adenylation domain-containing protein n=1 Tax=Gordonia sp. (in: high G+C Gram-positive bacteria) TaxID=84139 RepID=UPI003BB7AF89